MEGLARAELCKSPKDISERLPYATPTKEEVFSGLQRKSFLMMNFNDIFLSTLRPFHAKSMRRPGVSAVRKFPAVPIQ